MKIVTWNLFRYQNLCWLVGFLWHINFRRLFNVKTIFMKIVSSISNNSIYLSKTFLFQAIQFIQTVLIQPIQFSINISMQFSSIQHIDRALSGATTPAQSGPGRNGNEGVIHTPQSSSITGTLPSNCLYHIQDTHFGGGGVLPFCRGAVAVFYSPSWLANTLS